ncbi:hypothetical protein A9Q99_21110 [Gammaproteobacteria bacterium 45_16_T64]|nr:hypothetical protein A9Q99_21110 [Gammaproteobacteria bacterium 45_16_T64]
MTNNRKETALAAIKDSIGSTTGENGIDLFLTHHLGELNNSEWKDSIGVEKPTKQQIIESLIFKSSWDDDCVYDFTLPNDVTDYVVSVRFGEDGEIEGVSMES